MGKLIIHSNALDEIDHGTLEFFVEEFGDYTIKYQRNSCTVVGPEIQELADHLIANQAFDPHAVDYTVDE